MVTFFHTSSLRKNAFVYINSVRENAIHLLFDKFAFIAIVKLVARHIFDWFTSIYNHSACSLCMELRNYQAFFVLLWLGIFSLEMSFVSVFVIHSICACVFFASTSSCFRHKQCYNELLVRVYWFCRFHFYSFILCNALMALIWCRILFIWESCEARKCIFRLPYFHFGDALFVAIFCQLFVPFVC